MARRKGPRISEEGRRAVSEGRLKDAWKGARQKEKTVSEKIRNESGCDDER